MYDPVYVRQARLLVQCLPEVGRQACFALKGGTAINFFFRPMPRLSVDIDLAYLPLGGRDEALSGIARAMEAMAADMMSRSHAVRVQVVRARGTVTRLLVMADDVQIKVEPNHVLRGSVYPPETHDLCDEAQAFFEQFVSVPTLGLADLYGGKICASLDRQHPRDLYDVRLLLDNEGVTDQVRRAFVVYLASHDRPMSELLDPKFKELGQVHASEFAGMARDEVPVTLLSETRARLVRQICEGLDADEKRFLLSMKGGEPDWEALSIPHLRELPALQWKLENVRRMDAGKRGKALEKLRRALGM
jgi:predicted nucleotidyltransferase component of viral defense system